MIVKSLKSMGLVKVLSLSSLLLLLLPSGSDAGSAAPPAPPAPPVPAVMRTPAPPPAPDAPDADDDEARPKRGWLGVYLSEDDDGVSISGVRKGSPAEKAGLKEGDRFVEIDNQQVQDQGDIRRAIRNLEPGDTVQIEVMRDGKKKTVSATLGEAKSVFRHGEGLMPGWAPQAEDFEPMMQYHMLRGSRTYLGVHVQGMTEELRSYFKAPRGRGVLVSRVEEDTPAGKAGLRAGDVIIAVDGKGIAARGDIGAALSDKEPGDTVAVKIVRDGVEKTLDVEVEERPTPRPRRGSMMHPGHDEAIWFDEQLDEDGDTGVEIEDLEDVPDDRRIRLEIQRALEQAHKAMAESMRYRGDVQREIARAMRSAQLASIDPKQVQEQIRKEMARAKDAMREAAEEIRRAQEEVLSEEDGI